ncbi:MAG: hypothetical protein WBA12_02845, partial [Catalinimonas sp.]
TVALHAGYPWQHRLGTVNVEADAGWQTLTLPVDPLAGTHALWIKVWGDAETTVDLEWIRFE